MSISVIEADYDCNNFKTLNPMPSIHAPIFFEYSNPFFSTNPLITKANPREDPMSNSTDSGRARIRLSWRANEFEDRRQKRHGVRI
jgi:hypothetical protein